MTTKTEVTISNADAAEVIRHLTQRLRSLELWIDQEQSRRSEELVARIPEVIKFLRMHSVVLLYTGHGRASDLVEKIDDQATIAALEQVWNLDYAPLPDSVKEQLRVATVGGMNRF